MEDVNLPSSDLVEDTQMSYYKMPILDDSGFVVVDSYDQSQDPTEWLDIEYVDWKSSGDTRFSPLASAYGDLECDGFWNHTPAKTDKDGVWVEQNVELGPRLVERAKEPDVNIGRCRVIELQPNTYADAIHNLHIDDNNRLNPDGTGWIVRAFFNLTDDQDSVMILREDKNDPATETRVPLPAGTQAIIDTQRLYHAVWHPGDQPRYCLITSYESAPDLEAWIDARHPITRIDSPPVPEAELAEANRRQTERDQQAPTPEVMSEA